MTRRQGKKPIQDSTGEEDSLQVNPKWSEILPAECTASRNAKLHTIASLLLFLGLTFLDVILFLFSTNIKVIKDRARSFTSYNEGRPTPFPPAALFSLWHSRFPACRDHLFRTIISPQAHITVIRESNKGVSERLFSFRMKKCSIQGLRDALRPSALLAKYKEVMPFTFGLALAFCTSDNKYRRRKARKTAETEDASDVEMQFDDGNDAETLESSSEDGSDGSDELNGGADGTGGFLRFSKDPAMVVMLVLSMLLFTKNRETNLFPLILGLFLKIEGASSRIITTLNHAGLCVSVPTIDRLRVRLSEDAIRLAKEVICSGVLFFIIFDNINLYLRKSQQRIFNRNTMINATNAAVVQLPPDIDPAAFDLKNLHSLRGKRSDFDATSLKPSKEDDEHTLAMFHALITQMIVAYTPGSDKWKGRKAMHEMAEKLVPEDRPLDPLVTKTFPFGAFDVNEGSKKGVIKLMEEFKDRSGLSEEEFSGSVRILSGDFLSVRNVRSAKRDRVDDVNDFEQLSYIKEVPQLFHFALNATHMLIRVHLGKAASDPGSLSKHKDILGRVWDVNKPDYANAKALIRHSLISRLLHLVMLEKEFSLWSDLGKWRPNFEEVQAVAWRITNEYTSTAIAEDVLEHGDHYLAHSMLFIRDALLFCSFEHAVTFGDPGRVLRIFKYWACAFRGAGLHNYAGECLEILTTWGLEQSDLLRKATERSWFVNRWGLKGRFIASDLYLEQMNCLHTFKAEGAGLTIDYIIQKGSACVEAFCDVTRRVASMFGAERGHRRHKEVKFQHDLMVLVQSMQESKLHTFTPNRPIFAEQKPSKSNQSKPRQTAIVDVLVKGMDILDGGKLKEFLRNSTFDPAVGYPLGDDEQGPDISQVTETSFDSQENPLSYQSTEDVQSAGDADVEVFAGLGGLGGGDSF